MVPLWVIAGTILLGVVEVAHPPGSPPTTNTFPVYWIEGPRFGIPCKTDSLPAEVVSIELWYSTNNGKTWTRAGEIRRDERQFDFKARKAGDYLFAPRLRYKTGRADPADPDNLIANLKVVVGYGSEPEQTGKAAQLTAKVDELEDALTQLELDLIAKEIKRLAEANSLSPETVEKINTLRARLREVRERLRERDSLEPPGATPPSLPAVPPASDELPPTSPPGLNVPTIPTIPTLSLPVAPPPRLRESR